MFFFFLNHFDIVALAEYKATLCKEIDLYKLIKTSRLRLAFSVTRCQECLQNIWPFQQHKLAQKQTELYKVGSKVLHILIKPSKSCKRFVKFLPKWRNLAKSGHAASRCPTLFTWTARGSRPNLCKKFQTRVSPPWNICRRDHATPEWLANAWSTFVMNITFTISRLNARWISLCLESCRPRFKSHTIYAFSFIVKFLLYLSLHCQKERKQTRYTIVLVGLRFTPTVRVESRWSLQFFSCKQNCLWKERK